LNKNHFSSHNETFWYQEIIGTHLISKFSKYNNSQYNKFEWWVLHFELLSGVLYASCQTISSGVFQLRIDFSKSARVSIKNKGVILLIKKLSNQTDSSGFRLSRKDLSKIAMGHIFISY
jgi:putative component of toxin-antitoxin plasmid stabilization module